MGEWSFLSRLFDTLQTHSPMLGRFWLLLMLVFRILILGTVASDLFEDEQAEFACNTLQPGCKQVCYDLAFPISQYRFWVFHIVLISTPSLLFLVYAMHHHSKRTASSGLSQASGAHSREERRLRRLYIVNVAFRLVAEVGVLVAQWWLYGFKVEAQYPCSRFPCPYTVDCFTSRPAEKTVFLCFYFIVGVVSACSSLFELIYSSMKLFCAGREPSEDVCNCQNFRNLKMVEGEMEQEVKPRGRSMSEGGGRSKRTKAGPGRSSGRMSASNDHRSREYQTTNMLDV
ncbi:gap junction delta-3 protein-like [Aplochiton taeniatus]